MRRPIHLAVGLAAALLTVSGCASSDAPDAASATPTMPATASATASDAASPTPSTGGNSSTGGSDTTGSSGILPEGLRERPEVAAAIADTASREQVAPERVVIATWSPVTWNDGSLGCPQEGMSYTQALVDGELLVLRVEAGLFQYHAHTGGPFTYCATPSANYIVNA